jgi:hypothetical protein
MRMPGDDSPPTDEERDLMPQWLVKALDEKQARREAEAAAAAAVETPDSADPPATPPAGDGPDGEAAA